MRYTVRHRTVFDYTQPVSISHHLLHLEPHAMDGQTVESFSLLVEPAPAIRNRSVDYFGNPAHHLTVQDAHETLTILSTLRVDVADPPALDAAASMPWDAVGEHLRGARAQPDLGALECCFASPLVPLSDAVRAYAADSFSPGRPILEGAEDLMRRVFADFTYEGGVTDISTPIDTVLETRTGVCQDFAHLMIGGLRALGLPARYVSGYIRTVPPEGEKRLVGADASHAWVSVFAPGLGWVDFDPTNDKRRSSDHVTIAWGRDYGDVSPVTGLIVGGGDHEITVEVDVRPEGG
jgi:transglutaminase-like putative cysteine protease